jgi:hypothetical protein
VGRALIALRQRPFVGSSDGFDLLDRAPLSGVCAQLLSLNAPAL